MSSKIQRVIAYIDGFNLYYGLRESKWQRYYWLDMHKLASISIDSDHSLEKVKYFTSRVSSTPNDPDKNKRQNTYLEALETLPNFQIFYGHYLTNTITCRNCKSQWFRPEEKMTDVNIATEMIVDSFLDNFDEALLISADSDLIAPIAAIKKIFPYKKILIAFPPKRHSTNLANLAHVKYYITRSNLSVSQFPDPVLKANGFALIRPETWK